jgi:hypothetical protein
MTEVDRLQVALEHMDRLLDALEDLKQTILPNNPTLLAAMGEGPLEDLGRLRVAKTFPQSRLTAGFPIA